MIKRPLHLYCLSAWLLCVAVSTSGRAQFYRRWLGDSTGSVSPARFKGIIKYYPAQSGEYRAAYEKALTNGTSVEFDGGVIYHGYLLDGLAYGTEPALGLALRLSYRSYARARARRRRSLNGTYRAPLLMYRYVRYRFDTYGYDADGRDVVNETLRLRQHVVGLQYLLGRQINLARTFSFAVQYGLGMRFKFLDVRTSATESRAWLLERAPGVTLTSTPLTAIKWVPTLHLNLSVGLIRKKQKERRGLFGGRG